MIFPGVRVGKGAVVRNSVLLPGAVVADGALVDYTILAQNALIESGAQVVGEETQITVIPEGETVLSEASQQRVG